MGISLDGQTVARLRLSSRTWRSYGRQSIAREGRHEISVRLLNPRSTRRCSRALEVDSVTLTEHTGPRVTATPKALVSSSDTFQNPVYAGPAGGGFADPMVLKADGRYWAYATGGLFLTASSDDLVHWTDRGSAMTSRPAWTAQTGEWNPWAPSVIETDQECPGRLSEEQSGLSTGRCYVMYFTAVNPSVTPRANCIGVATSTWPGGPFTDRGILQGQGETVDRSGRPLGCGDDFGYSNIDAAPFVDRDGTPYLYFSTGHHCDEPAPNAECPWDRELSVVELAPDMLSAVRPRRPLLRNEADFWENGIVENPWVSRVDDRYELLYSGGNFRRAYGMGSSSAVAPTDIFTRGANPLLADGDRVKSAGGGSLVEAPSGTYVAYHGRNDTYEQPRTLRIDRLGRHADGSPWTDAPTSMPQPRP